MRRIQLALTREGCTVWRNETATAWVGKVVAQRDGHVVLDAARRMQAGLCKGSADLVGFAPDGRFLAVEVKTATGRLSTEQRAYIDAVARGGGIAYVARSVDDAIKQLRDYSDNETS